MKKLLLSLALAVSGFFGVSAETASITFSEEGYTNSQSLVDKSPIKVGDITLTFDKDLDSSNKGSNPPAYYDSGSAVRIYKNNKFTIQTEGYNIQKVVFSAVSSSYAIKNNNVSIITSYALVENGNHGTLENNDATSTWTGSTDTDCITIANKSSSQIRLTKIEVTYTPAGGGPVVPIEVEPVEISYEVKGTTADVTLSCATEGATIYYGTSQDAITNEYTGTFTVTESCTIYAFAQKDEAKSSVKSMKITLPYGSFKQAVKAAKDENVEVVGDFSVIYNSGIYLMLTDGISNILVYGLSNAPAVGTAISKVSGTVDIYRKLYELKNGELSVGGKGAHIAPSVLNSFSALDIDNNIFDYVTVNGCTISGQNDKSATLSLGDEEIALYNNFGINSFEDGTNLTVTGFVWRYNDIIQISPSEIIKNVDPSKQDPNLTFNERQMTFDMTETDEGMIQGQVVNAPEGLKITYSSNNPDGLDVDSDGLLYVSAPGSYTITASTEGNETYNAGWASYSVTVTNKYVLGEITVNGVAGLETLDVKVGDKITFAAENAVMLTFDIIGEKTNPTMPEGIEGSSYEWTVTAADTYMVQVDALGVNDEKTLTITIVATENAPVINNTITLDFMNNTYGMTRLSGSTSEYNPDPYTLTDTEGLSVVAYGATRLWSSDGLRLYKGGTLAITAPDKYIIAECEYTKTNSNFTTAFDSAKKQWTISYNKDSKQSPIATVTVTLGLDPERVSPVYENFVIEPNNLGGYSVKVSHDFDGVSVHYKHTAANEEEEQEVQARHAVDHTGFSQAEVDEEGNHAFTVDGPGVVEYYGYHSDTDTKGSVRTLRINADGSTTMITEINAAVKGAETVYDLMGRKVAAPVRGGLYIVNGAKHIAR